ncbi:DUF6374 family protein [Nocardia sp. NBC_01730]|uniref:DUF6374 family protein n=1 Tax=Nocardia sp. NBC_01730 TaxID=2975998 RepID=UPI002E145407|nr:DUF6374 family protein [Nocardia sp. NBC_01730]
MPELTRLDFAKMQVDDVRRQLLDAAAFGKFLPPEPLEIMARKLAEALRIYTEATQGTE